MTRDLRLWSSHSPDARVRWMAMFFRVIEQEDGCWACRHGRFEFDSHTAMKEAIEHMTAVASEQSPAEIFLHRCDGSVESLGVV